MFIINFIKKIFGITNTFREELEDCFATILEKIDGSTKIDELEANLLKNGMKLAIKRYNINIPDEAYNMIADKVVESLSKANKIIVKQLRKR